MAMFQPTPRPVLAREHELDPVAELVIANKKELKPHATQGPQVSPNSAMLGGKNIPVSIAAVICSHQIGIPVDHPDYPPIGKYNSAFPANDYYVLWGAAGKRIKWLKDESFWHVPGFSRYVINKDGLLKNASNGEVVVENALRGQYELVPDGPVNRLSKVYGSRLQYVALSRLPEKFIDYGFQNYNHNVGINSEGEIGWNPLPVISARSNVDGSVSYFRSANELIICRIKDFDVRKNAYKAIRDINKNNAVILGEFSVLEGKVEDKERFGPSSAAPTMAATDFETDLNF